MPELFEKPKTAEAKGKPELARLELDRYSKLKQYRDTRFMPAWQTLSQYFAPEISDINVDKVEGTTGWGDLIFDTTAIEDARTCATGQSNWCTPAAEPWFQWAPPAWMNAEDDDEASIWYGKCTEIALRDLARSNFYPQSGVQYKSRCIFGTGQLHIEEGKSGGINCTTRKIGTYCVAMNDEGIVDTIYSEFKLSARAAAQKFGRQNLSGKILKALEEDEGKNQDTEFNFLHGIRPRGESERDSGKMDGINKPFASIYIAMEDKVVVREGGYDEFPDSVTRFDDWGTGTVWGWSPAFLALPNVRQLNYVVRFMDAQYELLANPRILSPIGIFGQMDLRPGGITPYDPNVFDGAKPEEWMSKSDPRFAEDGADKKREAIHRLFYADVFNMLQGLEGQKTAYEIAQRVGEKLEQLSPMFGRLITEKSGPDLRRVFGIKYRAGHFPPPPRSVFVPDATGKRLSLAMPEVTYTSRLALALASLQNRATMDTLTFLSEFAANTGRADILDNFDLDDTSRGFALAQGMPARRIRPMKDVLKMRQDRVASQTQDRAMLIAAGAADAAGKLGKAPPKLAEAISDEVLSASGANVAPGGA